MTNIEYLKQLKNIIEEFSKSQQLDILKLLTKHQVNISENSNGSFVNLSDIDNKIIIEIQEYIDFINTQDLNLNKVENKKKNLEKEFF